MRKGDTPHLTEEHDTASRFDRSLKRELFSLREVDLLIEPSWIGMNTRILKVLKLNESIRSLCNVINNRLYNALFN
jgi:hypothetical protein